MGARDPRASRSKGLTQTETEDALQQLRAEMRALPGERAREIGRRAAMHDALCEAGDPEYMTTACRCAERQES